jgi:hypothetical protein
MTFHASHDLFTKVQDTIRTSDSTFSECVRAELQKKNFGYDQRIMLFKSLAKRKKKHKESMIMRDLYYWFPECQNHDIFELSVIPDDIVQNGLEIFLAELLERP